MQFDLDLDRVRANAQAASTEDLLDRVTFYRPAMESEALDVLEQELWRRGLTATDLDLHAQKHQGRLLLDSTGLPYQCVHCLRPAVCSVWRWYRLWGYIPLYPCKTHLCNEHAAR